MAGSGLPTALHLEIVTPEGLLLDESVEEVQVPGELGSFGVRPGHTPFLSTLGVGEIAYRQADGWHYLTCFWGFCEVLADRVNILAELGERAEDIDTDAAEKELQRARERMKSIKDEAGYEEARQAYIRSVTRLSVAKHGQTGS
jgi:F-type H+-transporting ATPase subunit epsilon